MTHPKIMHKKGVFKFKLTGSIAPNDFVNIFKTLNYYLKNMEMKEMNKLE